MIVRGGETAVALISINKKSVVQFVPAAIRAAADARKRLAIIMQVSDSRLSYK